MVEDGEMREDLLISPCDRLSSELSDTCGLGSVNDEVCSKCTRLNKSYGNGSSLRFLVRGRHIHFLEC